MCVDTNGIKILFTEVMAEKSQRVRVRFRGGKEISSDWERRTWLTTEGLYREVGDSNILKYRPFMLALISNLI